MYTFPHTCKVQTFGPSGRRRGWDDLREFHLYLLLCRLALLWLQSRKQFRATQGSSRSRRSWWTNAGDTPGWLGECPLHNQELRQKLILDDSGLFCSSILASFPASKETFVACLSCAGQAPGMELGKACVPRPGQQLTTLYLVYFRGEVPTFPWTHTTNRERWERTTGIYHVARPTSPHFPIWREAVDAEGFPLPPSPGACGKYVGLMINLVAIELGLWGSKLYCDLLLFFSSEPHRVTLTPTRLIQTPTWLTLSPRQERKKATAGTNKVPKQKSTNSPNLLLLPSNHVESLNFSFFFFFAFQ